MAEVDKACAKRSKTCLRSHIGHCAYADLSNVYVEQYFKRRAHLFADIVAIGKLLLSALNKGYSCVPGILGLFAYCIPI